MSSEIEHIEYDRDINPYPSFGKKYNGEKAIISMTSWKMRIATCSKTIYSLLKQCPGFHIVLVLSEEEFPKMCEELPENLMLFVENEMIELMFVYKNYKSFKKVLFTMDKYRDVPVISADDDCIYTCNYAQELYDKAQSCSNKVIVFTKCGSIFYNQGACSLYKSNELENFKNEMLEMLKNQKDLLNDDSFISAKLKQLNIPTEFCRSNTYDWPFVFHTTVGAINPTQYKRLHFTVLG